MFFVIHQTQVDGAKPLIRLFALAGAGFFGALTWYFFKRGSRKGPVLRLSKQGVGIALGCLVAAIAVAVAIACITRHQRDRRNKLAMDDAHQQELTAYKRIE